MKKTFIAACVAASLGIAGFNAFETIETAKLSDLALKNIEALSETETMTSEEFMEKTGCEAVWEDVTCAGRDGNTHTFAKPYEK